MTLPNMEDVKKVIKYMESCDMDGANTLLRTPAFNKAWNFALSILSMYERGELVMKEKVR